MNPHDTTLHAACADDAALEALVSGTLAPDRERVLEAHLGGCAACRGRLDALAASPESWSTVREQLSAGAEGDDADAVPPIPALATLIQKILAPSDDERMLGRLGPYEITGIIGSGGMGIVLKGHDRALDRFVAIKLLSPHLASSGAARQRFLREAKAAAAVVHDNVIAIHGVDEFAGLPYLVMPYCRGTTLEKRVRDAGPMSLREILRVGLQTARGLAAAHAQGLVHRDVKPANILLEDGVERVRITDFGLARAADDASLTVTGLLAGTPHYMSPEQALGKPLDARSDLFALGAVLFTLATGKPPFRAESSHAVLRMVTDVEPADVRLANPDMPAWLAGIIGRLLAKDPAARYPSASEVAATLEECLAHVNDPLAKPLPAAAAALLAPTPGPAAGPIRSMLTPSTFLARLRNLMSDQRLLSIAALVIFLMALLLPWPILALGRAEPAIIYAAIASLTSLLFAWLGRRDSLGRLVLKLAGAAAILGVAGISLLVLSEGRRNAQHVAALRAENFAKQTQMEAIARQQSGLVPMAITVPAGTRVASGPDPMPIVTWPPQATDMSPVLTTTVVPPAAMVVPPAPAEAPSPILPNPTGSFAPVPDASVGLPVLPEAVPYVPDASIQPQAAAVSVFPSPGSMGMVPPMSMMSSLTAGPSGAMTTVTQEKNDDVLEHLTTLLEAMEKALAEGRFTANATVTIRKRDSAAHFGLHPIVESRSIGIDDEPSSAFPLALYGPTTWQEEFTTKFLGRSIGALVADRGIATTFASDPDRIEFTLTPEQGDRIEEQFRVTFDHTKGDLVSKAHDVRFRRSETFRCMHETTAGDFREVAPGVRLPHRVTIDYHDVTRDSPVDEIPPLAWSIRVDIAEWTPTGEDEAEHADEHHEAENDDDQAAGDDSHEDDADPSDDEPTTAEEAVATGEEAPEDSAGDAPVPQAGAIFRE